MFKRHWMATILAAGAAGFLAITLVPPAAAAKQNQQVESVQQALRDRGYDPGPVNGVMGPQTRQALAEYQKAQDLPVTQRVDAKTLDSLGLPRPSTVGATYQTAGHDFATGGREFGTEIAKDRPIAAFKDLGKETGLGGAKIGQGTGKAVTAASKAVARVFAG